MMIIELDAQFVVVVVLVEVVFNKCNYNRHKIRYGYIGLMKIMILVMIFCIIQN